MAMERKRLFVGNLPHDINDEEIEQKFKHFGIVLSVELKQKSDSCFAYVDLETNRNKLNACFDQMSRQPWKGNTVRLDFAKESFLTRLNRERQEGNKNQDKTGDKTLTLGDSLNSSAPQNKIKVQKLAGEQVEHRLKPSRTSSLKYSKNSSDEQIDFKGRLPNFRGLKRELDLQDVVVKKPKKKSIVNKDKDSFLSLEEKLLHRFEAFSDDWKDDSEKNSAVTLEKHPIYTPLNKNALKEAPVVEKSDKINRKSNPIYTPLNKNALKEAPVVEKSDKINRKSNPIYTPLNKNAIKEAPVVEKTDKINRKSNPIYTPLNKNELKEAPVVEKTVKINRKSNPIVIQTNGINHWNSGKDFNSKQIIAEEKRMKSMEERFNSFISKKKLIQKALSSVDSKDRVNSKILFNSDDENSYDPPIAQTNTRFNNSNSSSNKDNSNRFKPKLFEDADIQEVDLNFNIKSQFEGEKGQKLLELQASFGNDERFRLDKRFLDDGESVSHVPSPENVEMTIDEEKKRDLQILESILGYSVTSHADKKNVKSKSMLRFDPTKPDHTKFEVQRIKKDKLKTKPNVIETVDDTVDSKKDTIEEYPPVFVSKETFSQVTDTLKESLKNKGKKELFSLRKMFGADDDDSADVKEVETAPFSVEAVAIGSKNKIGFKPNSFKLDSSDEEAEQSDQLLTVPPSASAVWTESFFFTENDDRLQGGIEFIKSKKIAKETEEDFPLRRRALKMLARSKVKNSKRNKYTLEAKREKVKAFKKKKKE